MFRIGYGYDVHQLMDDADFWLGGIKVPHSKGSIGHSDADVLIHSICDALLGAANLRDIGFHFPDTSDDYKGISSGILLKRVVDLLATKGYSLGNLDATICLQIPKIGPFIPAMQETIASIMNVSPDQISIKATTTEKLGFVGKEEGVSAHVVALILNKQQ